MKKIKLLLIIALICMMLTGCNDNNTHTYEGEIYAIDYYQIGRGMTIARDNRLLITIDDIDYHGMTSDEINDLIEAEVGDRVRLSYIVSGNKNRLYRFKKIS